MYTLDQHVRDFKSEHQVINEFDWKGFRIFVVDSKQTGKACGFYVLDLAKGVLVGQGFTTGHRNDNFTQHSRARVENYVFGVLKALAAKKRVESLCSGDGDSLRVCDVTMSAHDFLKSHVLSVVKGVEKLYDAELERPLKKGKPARFTAEDPVVAYCLNKRAPASMSFEDLQLTLSGMLGRIAELLPSSHPVVAKIGVGRSIPFVLLEDLNRLEGLDAGVSLVRALMATFSSDIPFYLADLAHVTRQELSLDDHLWACRPTSDLTECFKEKYGKPVESVLECMCKDTFHGDFVDWAVGAVLPGSEKKKLALANDRAYALIRAAYRGETATSSLVKDVFSEEVLQFMSEVGFVDFCERHFEGKSLLEPRVSDAPVCQYALQVAKGDFDVVDFFRRLAS